MWIDSSTYFQLAFLPPVHCANVIKQRRSIILFIYLLYTFDFLGARTAQAIIDSGLSAVKSMVKDRMAGGGRKSSSGGGGKKVWSIKAFRQERCKELFKCMLTY